MPKRSTRAPSEDDDDHNDNDHNDDDDEKEGQGRQRRSTSRRGNRNRNSSKRSSYADADADADMEEDPMEVDHSGRRSSRQGRYSGSLKEPPSDSVRDLFQERLDSDEEGRVSRKKKGTIATATAIGSSRRHRSSSSSNGSGSGSGSNTSKPVPAVARRRRASPAKSPARRHARARKRVTDNQEPTDDDEDSDASEADEYSERGSDDDNGNGNDNDDGGVGSDLKIQRILASRTETKTKWRELGQTMNSSEITDGSRWFQPPTEGEDAIVEERFLVKWSDLSYMHVSWETQADLVDQIEGATKYLSTFFRKSENGILFSADDRKDGDYFDPGYVQMDRILESFFETKSPTSWDEEMATTNATFDIVLDKTNEQRFEEGTGRQFLVKWEGSNYVDCTWEFERDFILGEVEYKPALKEFYARTNRPTAKEWKQLGKDADQALRKCYKLFGDNAKVDAEEKEKEVSGYQSNLANHIFPNGGQLRDYQAEGVTWYLSNYVNQRSCILADEMGLGKTLQTAAFVNLLVEKMHRPGPFLIVVPLSTVTHWQREFVSWTGLNTIVYHGSAEDRKNIRQHEFAFAQDRPDSVGSNAIYLNKCAPHKKGGGAWMATVVVTTPEMIVADDWAELAAVQWEVLVVDEAHRLKNHTSKLATNMRKEQFSFKHKVLLTGTPIQNDIKEFWTLLNFIDPEEFPDVDEFMDEYGDMKSKEKIDHMHETIRPYILRRLKEDVEKSVPPKEETLIEVELTLQQKQYYRALYEKNISFLHKNKKKALDGPSLNNLAMQLRKCCNHLFLLNGVEVEIRKQKENQDVSEADILARGSGKLVLLDKLLPRLKEDGHRVLIFSQFKIMLDVLEDYLHAKQMKFERIDGSITGHRRQAAIDRFQDPNSKNPPFVMLLSTRAGGVGINLTAADTCIIFDSDWNPQNDLQAQARCHRIGQTKNVKVYRLLSRKTYEMQMFHMSSLKMGLDQAVLKGFESGSSEEGAMTKEEVERLLRHGAYDIFNEEKAGTAEAESKNFIEQDIDSILLRRSKTVVHENTGSGSNAAGGTFSKASFIAPKTDKKGEQTEDVDIADPEFWTKMVGEAKPEAESVLKPRKRNRTNYSEKFYERQLHQIISLGPDPEGSASSESEAEDVDDSDSEIEEETEEERVRWGGQRPNQWKKSYASRAIENLERYGYGVLSWPEFKKQLPNECEKFSETEIRRMVWSLVLFALCEVSKEDATAASKRAERQAERQREKERGGDILAEAPVELIPQAMDQRLESSFQRLWKMHSKWVPGALSDAVAFANMNVPRSAESLEKSDKGEEIAKVFYGSVWDSLKGRGWKEESAESGKVYKYVDQKFDSPSSVMNEVVRIHPELRNMVLPILNQLEQSRLQESTKNQEDRSRDLGMNNSNINFKTLKEFLVRYAPLQLLGDRKRGQRLAVGRRILSSCSYMNAATWLVKKALADKKELKNVLSIDARSGLPHAEWTLDHDAILIKAISRHGWVDREKALRAIVDDSVIEWGFPFEMVEPAAAVKLSDEELSDLKSTAHRGSQFLQDFGELLLTLKGCNRHLLIESYGLKHHVDDNDTTKSKWVVDDELLHTASATNEGMPGSSITEPADLPTKRDMVKRARIVLQKSIAALDNGGVTPSTKTASSKAGGTSPITNHGYAVIDQGNRCCILLAEMVRGIAKGSHSKSAKDVRMLCSLAYEEALELSKLFVSKETQQYQQRSQELQRIADQILLARKCFKISAIPAKNIFRVMIGLDPLQPKNPNDPLFPSQDYIDKHTFVTQTKKKPKPKEDAGALGDRAVVRSLRKAHEKSTNGIPNVFANDDDFNVGMQLTMTEALILLSLCSDGMPLSRTTTKGKDGAGARSWEQLLAILDILSKEFYMGAQEKVLKTKAVLAKLHNLDDLNPVKTEAAQKVAAAEWEEALSDEAARQVVGMDVEPFAKKSIMLLEKIRRSAFAGSAPNSKTSHKFENYLGPKLLTWMGKELASSGAEFDVVDNTGKPMCFSTTDLLLSNPEFADTRVAAYMDKRSSRQVISQITVLCRLRSLFLKAPEEDAFLPLVKEAMMKSKKLADQWDNRPLWWDDDSVENTYLLLKTLTEKGFSNVLETTVDFQGSRTGDAEESNHQTVKDVGFSKLSMQQRANQIVRELHAMDESSETLRLLEQRRTRGAAKKQGFDRSLAECHAGNVVVSGGGSTSTTAPKRMPGIQTGLRAFFGSTSSKKASKVMEVEEIVIDDDEVEDRSSSPSSKSSPTATSVLELAGKRKESPRSVNENKMSTSVSSSSKKAKKMAPLFRVVPAKSSKNTDVASSPSNPMISPDKKLETVVNADGVIELVTVPRK